MDISYQNFEKRATSSLRKPSFLEPQCFVRQKANYFPRDHKLQHDKNHRKSSTEMLQNWTPIFKAIHFFLSHTIETSVTWHSSVVHVWNFVIFLQKKRRPKSSDSFPIRNLCKHSLPCPQDIMRGDNLVISTKQNDWLLRSQNWPTSISFSQFQYIQVIKKTSFENY